MSDSTWRRRLALAAVLVGLAVAVRRLRTTPEERAAGETGAVAADGPDEGVTVELDEVSVGEDLSIATGGLDPTVAAEVLELNEEAAALFETAEAELVREPIETATGGAVEVPDVEDRLAERVRESTVSGTAVAELEALGFRGLLDFDGPTDGDDE
jgi:hypothetical protein